MVGEFDDIRSYYDYEINDAMLRIVENPLFEKVAGFLYPDTPFEAVKERFRSFDSIKSFQVNVMNNAIQNILKLTSSGFYFSGMERLSPSKRYLFLSNHRDVLLDAAILQIVLFCCGHETSEITFGDNLMSSQFVVDIGKSNKMFKLIRGGSPKQIFVNSLHTSRYIRYCINEKMQSIWIAQRNGRTKDGDDHTQQAVLKMLGMSGDNDFVKKYSGLNIAPLIISYEYDPCDFLKTRELYLSRNKPYVKSPGEDLNSMLTGIRQHKGHIQMIVAAPISDDDLLGIGAVHKNEQIEALARLIDKRVYENYKLWTTHYIAYDILYGSTFEDLYSPVDRTTFIDYMNMGLSVIDGDRKELESIFLGIYANPVVNYLKINSSGRQSFQDEIHHFEYTV